MADVPPLPSNVTHSPHLTNAPPPGRQFPCIQCGARLDFDPSARALKCPYCQHTQIIDPTVAGDEKEIEAYLRRATSGMKTLIAGRSSQVRCTGCGATVLLEDKVVTERCPYCHTHLENKPEVAQEMIDPESILPFAISQRDAQGKFIDWLHGLWFAPSPLRTLATLRDLNGVYVPYWTYDAMTYTRYNGMRGDNYTESQEYTERDASGKETTKTRTVTKTHWYHVSGEVDHFFDDVLIVATESLPAHLVSKFSEWELAKLEGFKADYLAGFLTERYAVNLEQGLDSAKQVMDGTIRELCRADIGGDHQKVEAVFTQHVGVTFKHLLLPIWMTSYYYQNKLYQILINGQTGEVAGDRPWSIYKIVRLVGIVLLGICAIVTLILYLQK